MVGEGRPSTSFLAAISKDVDGGPEPVLGRAFGPTRGPTMTGEAKPERQPFRPLALRRVLDNQLSMPRVSQQQDGTIDETAMLRAIPSRQGLNPSCSRLSTS